MLEAARSSRLSGAERAKELQKEAEMAKVEFSRRWEGRVREEGRGPWKSSHRGFAFLTERVHLIYFGGCLETGLSYDGDCSPGQIPCVENTPKYSSCSRLDCRNGDSFPVARCDSPAEEDSVHTSASARQPHTKKAKLITYYIYGYLGICHG